MDLSLCFIEILQRRTGIIKVMTRQLHCILNSSYIFLSFKTFFPIIKKLTAKHEVHSSHYGSQTNTWIGNAS